MSQAVPKLIQRFRARELQRLVEPSQRGRPVVNLNRIRTDSPLHNPFLPRPLFNPDVNAETSSSADTDAGTSKTANVNAKSSKSVETQEKKERKKWMEARYSLRRQAVLVKMARASGTLHLLPPGPKLSVEDLEAAKREAGEREAVTPPAVGQADELKVEANEEEETRTKSESVVENDEKSSATQPPTASLTKPLARRQHRRHAAALGYPDVVFHWTGKVPTKTRKGLTIYAGRRRMFKGHKWERHLDKRRGQIAVRMRDMPKRVERFKNLYRRRRPNPLKPAAPRKKESLPF